MQGAGVRSLVGELIPHTGRVAQPKTKNKKKQTNPRNRGKLWNSGADRSSQQRGDGDLRHRTAASVWGKTRPSFHPPEHTGDKRKGQGRTSHLHPEEPRPWPQTSTTQSRTAGRHSRRAREKHEVPEPRTQTPEPAQVARTRPAERDQRPCQAGACREDGPGRRGTCPEVGGRQAAGTESREVAAVAGAGRLAPGVNVEGLGGPTLEPVTREPKCRRLTPADSVFWTLALHS